MASGATEYAELFNTEADARRLTRHALLYYLLLYGHFAGVLATALPGWTLALSAPILIGRWMIATHELFHLRDERAVDPVTRLMPIMLTPLLLGYKEFLIIHRGHHTHSATPDDPEYFQLRGSPLAGFLNALSAPEQSYFRWLAHHGADAELLIGSGIRLGLFCGLAWLAGPMFLWYWLPVRIAFGLAYFAFFYCLHRDHGAFGVYARPLPAGLAWLFGTLLGREAMMATCHHDAHHRHPRVSAFHLDKIPAN